MPDAPDDGALERLRRALHGLERVVVAFSGGADSSLLAFVAHTTLGPRRVTCVTAVSPSLAPEELDDCRALASEWGLSHLERASAELEDPAYARNGTDRCYHCKSSLMDVLEPLAAERGARFPLVEAGLTKHEVRHLSRRLGLRTWDKPAAACLASRVPYGTPVALSTLRAVAAAESALI